VQGVRAAHGSDYLPDIEMWFIHGDPWHVLIGVGASRLVVGSVDMFEGGYAGPSTLTCRKPVSFARDNVDVATVASAVQRARRSTTRYMSRCSLCDSPRYGSGCRCDDLAYGIIYDYGVGMQKAINEENFGAWVIKCHPEVWDVMTFLELGHEHIDSWSIRKSYRTDLMKPGHAGAQRPRRCP